MVIALTIISCKKEVPNDKVVLTGEITNNRSDLKVNFWSGVLNKIIDIKSDGSLRDTLEVDNGVYYTFRYGYLEVPVYYTKGSKIHFKADGEQFLSTIQFSGDHAGFNNYLAYKAKKEYDAISINFEFYGLNEEEVEDYLKNIQEDLLKKLKEVEGLTEDIRRK